MHSSCFQTILGNFDDNHAFFHSFLLGHWGYGKHVIFVMEHLFYHPFPIFLMFLSAFFWAIVYKCTNTRQLRSIHQVSECDRPVQKDAYPQTINRYTCGAVRPKVMGERRMVLKETAFARKLLLVLCGLSAPQMTEKDSSNEAC